MFALEQVLKEELIIYLMIWLNLNWGSESQEQIEVKILDIFLLVLQIIGKDKEIEKNNKFKIYL